MAYAYDPNASSTNPYLDALLWGTAWNTSASHGVGARIVTYSIDDGHWFNSFGTDATAAINSAVQCYENVCNIDFVNVPSGNPNDATYYENIAFVSVDNKTIQDYAGAGTLGFANFPTSSALYDFGMVDDPNLSSVFINNQGTGFSSSGLAKGGYGYVTLIHEFGHALGLAHPHDNTNGQTPSLFPGVTAAFGDFGDYNQNQGIFTTMSYNDGWQSQFGLNPNLGYGYQGTPMAFDVAALQQLYGANTTYQTGANTYVLPSVNASGTFFSCIWDAGGNDTISNQGSAKAATINLIAAPLTGANAGGYVSWASGIMGGYTIANGVVIENAIGGSGNDTITGNAYDNLLTAGSGNDSIQGGDGNDTLQGDDGNDTLEGGLGDDVLTGGGGVDVASYATATSAVTVSLETSVAQSTSGAGSDTLTMIEGLIGSGFNDLLTGSSSANSVSGGIGADTIIGGAGADTLLGDDGNDLFLIFAASDFATGEVITGGAGIDEVRFAATSASTLTLTSSVSVERVVIGTGTNSVADASSTNALNVNAKAISSAVTIIGNAGANILNGGSSGDTIDGGAGNDTLVGGAGADTFIVSSGIDAISDLSGTDVFTVAAGSTANATVTADWTATTATTNAGTATLTSAGFAVNFSAVTGGSAGYRVTNSGLATTLTGSKFADTLTGGGGADTLVGGSGADSLLGGDGNDLFIVALAADLAAGEVITGGTGTDELRFTSTTASTLTLTSTTVVERVVIATGNSAVAVTTGTTALDVNAGDVIGAVTMVGNAGANRLTGGGGNDSIDGGAGDDTLVGGAGADRLTGGSGNDTFSVASGTDTITDLSGNDIFTVGAGAIMNATVTASWTATSATTNAGTANLTSGGIAVNLGAVTGGSTGFNVTNTGLATTLTGSKFADTLTGGSGADTLVGGAGADSLIGGNGNDVFIVALAADLATGEVITGGLGTDELRFTSTTSGSTLVLTSTVAVEKVVIGTGTAASAVTTDTTALNVNASALAVGISITGNAGDNRLTGGTGADSLNGGAGADTLVGGLGNDTLIGGLGADVFIFNTKPNSSSNLDFITDFNATDDDIGLDRLAMTGLGQSSGALGSDAFWSGNNVTTSHDPSDRILYNKTTGVLYYDADGTGSIAAVKIAQLTAGTLLTEADFFIL